MCCKRIVALLTSAVLVLSCAACGKEDKAENNIDENPVADFSEIDTTVSADETKAENTVVSTDANGVTVADKTDAITTAEIVAMYKAAAAKTHKGAKSYQKITLVDFSINNGEYAKVIDFVMPVISKLLENNSSEVDGITGGFNNLTESDVKYAKTYSDGNKTVIEFILHEQTGGARDSKFSGTVGHAINTVGDIGYVTDQIADLGIPLEISDKNTTIEYKNPVVKVVIDSNGKIVSGTWSYRVTINLNQYKVGKKTVDSTKIVMDNVLTVGGGFKK